MNPTPLTTVYNALAETFDNLSLVAPELEALYKAIERNSEHIQFHTVFAFLAAQAMVNDSFQAEPSQAFDRNLMVLCMFFESLFGPLTPIDPGHFHTCIPTVDAANALRKQASDIQLASTKPVNGNVN